MATVVQNPSSPISSSGTGGKGPPVAPGATTPAPPGKGRFQVHKAGEGYATRLGMFVVAFLFMVFSAHHWYYGWKFLRIFAAEWLWMGSLLRWAEEPKAEEAISLYGSLLVAAVGLLIAYYYLWVQPRSSEFLIKTDGELAKVNWPKITPWFKPDTKVWGATYVVLIVVAALTVYVFGVDFILQFLARVLFYGDH